jgi:hypothetical protein
MRELRSEVVGDRRVRLVATDDRRYAVMIEVWGPHGWEDISLRADGNLSEHAADQRFRLRLAEQEIRLLDRSI